MKVVFLVMGHAVEFFPGKRQRQEIEFAGPLSIRDILRHIGVRDELVMYASSSGIRRDKDYVPMDGEELVVFTPPAGG